MATEILFKKIQDTFHYEIASSASAFSCKEVNLVDSKWDQLGSAWHEGLNDHVRDGLANYQKIFEEVNQIHPIPETLKYFYAYRDAALA